MILQKRSLHKGVSYMLSKEEDENSTFGIKKEYYHRVNFLILMGRQLIMVYYVVIGICQNYYPFMRMALTNCKTHFRCPTNKPSTFQLLTIWFHFEPDQ